MPLDFIMGLPLEESESHGAADVFVRDMQEKSADAYALAHKHFGIATEQRKTAYKVHTCSDVNKDLGLKAKAKAKDSDPKAKVKDLSHKAKAKDLGPKAKAKDSIYQGQIFHRSSPYSIHHFFIVNVVWVFLCSRTISRVNYILSLYEQMDMLLLLMTTDKEECKTVNTQQDDNYHKISHTTHIDHYKFTTVSWR